MCGFEFSGPSSSSPRDGMTFPRYYTSTRAHRWCDYISRKYSTLTLCTDNLTYETHDDSYKVLKEANHNWYCSCGTLRTTADMYGCSKCGYIAATGVKHLDGSKTSSGCGSNVPSAYQQHTYLNITSCPTHPKAGATVHYASTTMEDGYYWYMVDNNQPSESQRIGARKGNLDSSKSGSHSLCTICGEAFGGSESVLHKAQKPQAEQIISATLSSSSVGYGTAVPKLTVSGSHTTLSYSSSNTGVATISSTGVITICGCGSTIFTITAVETNDWTSAKATASLTVEKGNISIKTVPKATSVAYGQTLKSSTLSGGITQNASGNTVGGKFSWKTPSAYPENAKVYAVRFVPTETTLYNY